MPLSTLLFTVEDMHGSAQETKTCKTDGFDSRRANNSCTELEALSYSSQYESDGPLRNRSDEVEVELAKRAFAVDRSPSTLLRL